MASQSFIKQNANKEGAKTLLWLFVLAIVIMFGVQIMKLIRKGFSWMSGEADEEKLNAQAGTLTNQAQTLATQSGYSPMSLPKPINYYKQIADDLEGFMQGWGTKSAEMRNLLAPLNKNELLAVYYAFGGRVNQDFSNEAGNLFKWFGWELSDYSPFDFGALTLMRKKWAITGLPITF